VLKCQLPDAIPPVNEVIERHDPVPATWGMLTA
jgi:hypothetical protein